MEIVATTSLPAVDRPNADRWNAARLRQFRKEISNQIWKMWFCEKIRKWINDMWNCTTQNINYESLFKSKEIAEQGKDKR